MSTSIGEKPTKFCVWLRVPLRRSPQGYAGGDFYIVELKTLGTDSFWKKFSVQAGHFGFKSPKTGPTIKKLNIVSISPATILIVKIA
jgi:hypothetical protein